MRIMVLSNRTIKELVRDPLSYIFCLGFPLVMLVIMTVVDQSIPKEAKITIFHIKNLAPGIALFGLTFVMLFTCLQVSKDRAGAFLTRLYMSPARAADFISGYTLPSMIISILQIAISFTAASVIGVILDTSFRMVNVVLCVLVLMPSALLFIAFGLFFGTLLNDKTAPAVSSIVITAASMLGGVWMDVDAVGGVFQKICHVLPFYQGVNAARLAMQGKYVQIGKPLAIVFLYAFVFYLISALLFHRKMQSDLK